MRVVNYLRLILTGKHHTVFFLLAVLFSSLPRAVLAAVDDCSLPTVTCRGGIVGAYKYGAGVGTLYDTPQQATDAWGDYFERTIPTLCSFTATPNGFIDFDREGSGNESTTDRRWWWYLGEAQAQVMSVDGTTGSYIYGSACEITAIHTSPLLRTRSVICPKGYSPNSVTAPIEDYCFSLTSLVPDKNGGEACPLMLTKNPINTNTGNKLQKELDMSNRVIRFERIYNSVALSHRNNESMGINWRHSFDRSISGPEDASYPTAYVFRPNGRVFYFNESGGSYTADADVNDTLVKTGTGWEYTTQDNTIELYNDRGRLYSITDILGHTQTLSYDEPGRLDRVDTNTGEYIQLGYDASDRVSTLTDHIGRSWTYRYDTDSNLEYVDNPDGTTRQYHYEDPLGVNIYALTGITDERGIRYSTYGYDGIGRAKSSSLANNVERIDIVYNPDQTRTITNDLGQVSTYNTAIQLGVSLVTDIIGPGCAACGTGNTSYHYDPSNNNLLSRTENSITTKFGNYEAKSQFGCKVEGVNTADTSTGICAFNPSASPEARRTDYSYDPRFNNKTTSITTPSVFNP